MTDFSQLVRSSGQRRMAEVILDLGQKGQVLTSRRVSEEAKVTPQSALELLRRLKNARALKDTIPPVSGGRPISHAYAPGPSWKELDQWINGGSTASNTSTPGRTHAPDTKADRPAATTKTPPPSAASSTSAAGSTGAAPSEAQTDAVQAAPVQAAPVQAAPVQAEAQQTALSSAGVDEKPTNRQLIYRAAQTLLEQNISFTRNELAELAGVKYSVTTKPFGELEEQGIITRESSEAGRATVYGRGEHWTDMPRAIGHADAKAREQRQWAAQIEISRQRGNASLLSRLEDIFARRIQDWDARGLTPPYHLGRASAVSADLTGPASELWIQADPTQLALSTDPEVLRSVQSASRAVSALQHEIVQSGAAQAALQVSNLAELISQLSAIEGWIRGGRIGEAQAQSARIVEESGAAQNSAAQTGAPQNEAAAADTGHSPAPLIGEAEKAESRAVAATGTEAVTAPVTTAGEVPATPVVSPEVGGSWAQISEWLRVTEESGRALAVAAQALDASGARPEVREAALPSGLAHLSNTLARHWGLRCTLEEAAQIDRAAANYPVHARGVGGDLVLLPLGERPQELVWCLRGPQGLCGAIRPEDWFTRALQRPGPGGPDKPGQNEGQQEIGQQDGGQQEIGQQEIGQQEIGQQEIGQQEMGQQATQGAQATEASAAPATEAQQPEAQQPEAQQAQVAELPSLSALSLSPDPERMRELKQWMQLDLDRQRAEVTLETVMPRERGVSERVMRRSHRIFEEFLRLRASKKNAGAKLLLELFEQGELQVPWELGDGGVHLQLPEHRGALARFLADSPEARSLCDIGEVTLTRLSRHAHVASLRALELGQLEASLELNQLNAQLTRAAGQYNGILYLSKKLQERQKDLGDFESLMFGGAASTTPINASVNQVPAPAPAPALPSSQEVGDEMNDETWIPGSGNTLVSPSSEMSREELHWALRRTEEALMTVCEELQRHGALPGRDTPRDRESLNLIAHFAKRVRERYGLNFSRQHADELNGEAQQYAPIGRARAEAQIKVLPVGERRIWAILTPDRHGQMTVTSAYRAWTWAESLARSHRAHMQGRRPAGT